VVPWRKSNRRYRRRRIEDADRQLVGTFGDATVVTNSARKSNKLSTTTALPKELDAETPALEIDDPSTSTPTVTDVIIKDANHNPATSVSKKDKKKAKKADKLEASTRLLPAEIDEPNLESVKGVDNRTVPEEQVEVPLLKSVQDEVAIVAPAEQTTPSVQERIKSPTVIQSVEQTSTATTIEQPTSSPPEPEQPPLDDVQQDLPEPPSKKNKKAKKASKRSSIVEAELSQSSTPTDQITKEASDKPVDDAQVSKPLDIDPDVSSKSKNEKRKSKKDVTVTDQPSVASAVKKMEDAEPKHVPVLSKAEMLKEKAPAMPSSVKNSPAEQGVPTLNKKPSKTQTLAALFERGTTAEESTASRTLRKEGGGSVKDLAERYENQSRSVTPVLQSPSKRSASRVSSPDKLRSLSSAYDVDFAATLAASLSESGFDPGYVINDPTFHRSSSPHSIRDFGYDDEVGTAKERATTSRLGNWSRSSSFSGSPRIRPVKHPRSNVLPPIEVAVASTDAISFDPLDVLNDPTFLRRKTPPGVLEEADPDELLSSSRVNARTRGRRHRAVPSETVVNASPTRAVKVVGLGQDKNPRPAQQDMRSGETLKENSSTMPPGEPNVLTAECSTDAVEDRPVTTSRKGKEREKKRASRTQDRVENAAHETPVIETPTKGTLAVEICADSTAREAELEKSASLPSTSKNVPVQLEDPVLPKQVAKKNTDAKDEAKTTTSKKSRRDRSITDMTHDGKLEQTSGTTAEVIEQSRPLPVDEPSEYPFPEVLTPIGPPNKISVEATKDMMEKDRDMDTQSSKEFKKEKKSKKGKEKAENQLERQERQHKEVDPPPHTNQSSGAPGANDIEGTPVQQRTIHENHKRRAHPVPSDEDEPEGKRPHTADAPRHSHLRHTEDTNKRQSTPSGLSATIEPAWSFAGVGDDASDVIDSRAQSITPHSRGGEYQVTNDRPVAQQHHAESVPDTSREKKRKSKEPKTPVHQSSRSLGRGEEVTDSPSFPDYATYTGVSTPSGTDRATKERTSYLFDSSPSTREFEPPAVIAPEAAAVTHARSTRSHVSSQQDEKTGSKSQLDRQPSPKKAERAEPYQSIFGDPNEKASSKSSTVATPNPKHARTPSNLQLDTIKEASPDSPLYKKSRAITDVGAPERGVKSARHTESPKPHTDRLTSPPPATPTPSSRTAGPSPLDASGRRTPSNSKDTPWHQANDSVDRTMALSPSRRLPRSSPSMDPIKQQVAEQRSPSVRSERSMSNIAKLRSSDQERPLSSMSTRSTHSLRRVDKSASGDLRNTARLGEVNAPDARCTTPNLPGVAAGATAAIVAASRYDPVRGEGKGRRASMAAETFEAWGEAQGSPMSPTRPPSVRKRQSMQIIDLQTQIDQLAAHNHSLEEAARKAEETLQAAQHQRQVDEQLVAEEVEARDREIHKRDIDIAQLKDTIQRLHEEIARLTELNNTLNEANCNLTNDANERYAQLQSEGQLLQQQWQASQREVEALRGQKENLTRGMADAVRDEIGIALDERNAEIDRLTAELASAKEQVKALQKQILATKKPGESFLTIRDEDYFDSACQQLCQHVQQWVLRFSKFSDTRPCRLSSEISADTRLDASTRQKIDTRLDNAILDGSDVDALLADRVRRRDVFMSVVMAMIWEYVFTRYLFGMDREQRQKLKSLEKTLSEVGPQRAVAQWRAITLTLLSKREPFIEQRAQDTEAVVHEIYSTLSTLLPPPSNLQRQIQESLRNVMRLAVELSLEMRTQRAEYIMLPPLQPEYDTNGDLVAKVTFNASLMNERSGDTTSNDELEKQGSTVKVVLFPLVVKKGDDFGEGEDELVVCPAQVLVAKPSKRVVRVSSQAMSITRPDSRSSRISRMTSIVPDGSVMDLSK